MIRKLLSIGEQETEEHWVSISDVMAGLMVIFLFIAISYMINADRKKEGFEGILLKIENLVDVYRNLQAHLAEDLRIEYEGDPAKQIQFRTKWRGHLDRETLSIRFRQPFTQGKDTVPDDFRNVLDEFFPRYIAILTRCKYKDEIDEIRIEGHTSGEWHREVTFDEAYFKNMELSQNRARNVLRYVLGIKHVKIVQNKKEWIKGLLTANGLSSSKPIRYPDGSENREESRRVEFRVVTKSEKLINELKRLLEEFNKAGGTN